jgi:hypothetical protein
VPGMNSGLSPADPVLVAAFRSALLHQGLIVLVVIAFVWLVWATARAWRLTTPGAGAEAGKRAAGPDGDTCARARRRIRRAGGVRVRAHRLAADHGGLGQGPGDRRTDPVRLLGLGRP